jgi:hypothetical protein
MLLLLLMVVVPAELLPSAARLGQSVPAAALAAEGSGSPVTAAWA